MPIEKADPPKISEEVGSNHPITKTKYFLLDILARQGFENVDGPELETEEFNFDMLNIKKTHPARQMHDTFYVMGKKEF